MEDEQNNYEVEAVLEKATDAEGADIYKVKWKGFSADECTWEPYENVQHLPKLLE